MSDHNHHGDPTDTDGGPDAASLVALVRSIQDGLDGLSDDQRAAVSTQLDDVADGITTLGEELHDSRHYAAHLREHWLDCEASSSYRIGHTVVRIGKTPQRWIASLRSSRS